MEKSEDTFVWGFKGVETPTHAKVLEFKNIKENIYSISDEGIIYSRLNDCYISWGYHSGIPYVNLLNNENQLCSFNIKDLVACNFIKDYKCCIERGYKVVNIDGNPSNCKVSNLIMILPI